jgi:ParB family chromosome partitioning protein
MTTQEVPLSKIHANPWQTRTEEEPETVQRIADSIATEGLLQTPIGRLRVIRSRAGEPGHVQLAFGHTRLAAHKLLKRKTMPVEVRDLTDRQMAELAIRENRDRSDLSPIEEARAMHAYMRDFSATSAEVATLWGLADVTIRSKLRLLRLPEAVQAHVHEGRIAERTARYVLSVARLDAAKASELADDLASSEELNEELITERIAESMGEVAQSIGSAWHGGTAGQGWWKLDEAFQPGAVVNQAELVEALAEFYDGDAKQAATAGHDVVAWLEAPEGVQLREDIPAEAIERVKQLSSPPACTACSYHAEIGGEHFCSLNACYQVKKRAWIAADVARVQRSKRLKGIGLYSRKEDGPKLAQGSNHDDTTKKKIDAALAAGKLDDLRLAVFGTPAYRADERTGSYFVEVVLVGKAAVQAKKQRDSRQDYNKRYEAQRKHVVQARRVLEAAGPHFAALFVGLKDWDTTERMLRLLTRAGHGSLGIEGLHYKDDPKPSEKARLAAARRFLGRRWVEEAVTWTTRGKGAKATVKRLQAFAQEQGVRLPEGWADQALADPEAEAVSGDTE